MYPVAFHLGSWAVPTHDLFIAVGLLAATLWFLHEARVQQVHDPRIWWIVAGALISGGLFARTSAVVHWADDPERSNLAELFVHGGRSILGGLAGAYAGVLVTKRLVGYRSSTGDQFAPAVALGMAVGRIGCLLTEQIGTPTSLPWGYTPPADLAAGIPECPPCTLGVPLHPSFLYEVLFQLGVFVVLVRWRRRPHHAGDLFLGYLAAYGAFRFAVEFVRGNRVLWFGLSGPQVFLLVTLPLLYTRIALLVRRRRSAPVAELDLSRFPPPLVEVPA